MPRAVRILKLALAVALALGLVAGVPFALLGRFPVGTETPEVAAAAPALLPPLDASPVERGTLEDRAPDVQPVVFEDSAVAASDAKTCDGSAASARAIDQSVERLERLEASVGRLAGLLEEDRAAAAPSPVQLVSAPLTLAGDRVAQGPGTPGSGAPAPASSIPPPAPMPPGGGLVPDASLPPAGLGNLALPPIADPMDPIEPLAPYGAGPLPLPPGTQEPIELETTQEIPISELIQLLGRGAGFNVVVSPSVTGSVSASLRDVSGLDALNALLRAHGYILRRDGNFLFVGKPGDFSDMARLDDRTNHRVYRPRFVTATELQTLLAPILSETGRMTVTRAAEVGIATSSDQTGGDAYAGEEILLIRDWETNLSQCDAVVADVDRMPLQAAIEAVILSVELDDEHRCGVNLDLLRGADQTRIVSGNPSTTTLATMDLTNGGLNVGFLSAHVGAFVEALEEIGDTQVVARPRVTCVNKQRAEILIGDQIGYLSTTQTETATTQTVEFLDVGTQLRIRPFIAPEGVIRLEVHPELSSGEVRLVGDTPLPEKSTTQVTTNILCRDGATVVIGGLIREETIVNTGQVPLIGDVPWLGVLFRQKTESTRRTELIVLITPRIVRDPLDACDGQGSWEGLAERQTALFNDKKIEFLARMSHAQQYGRLAQSAYIAGNFEKAARYANIALQFHPKNETALSILGRLEMEATAWPKTPYEGAPYPAAGPSVPYDMSSGTEIYSPPTSGPLSLGPPVGGMPGTSVEPGPYDAPVGESFSYTSEGVFAPVPPPAVDVAAPPAQGFQP